MKHEIKNFFLSQINEHELVIEKTKSSVERNFLNLVNICVKSLKNGKKKNFVVTPSLACGYYKDGNEIKAGNPLEFYIGIDMFYRFKNNSRIGVGIFHISNADSGKKNPGSETLVLKYQIPMGR